MAETLREVYDGCLCQVHSRRWLGIGCAGGTGGEEVIGFLRLLDCSCAGDVSTEVSVRSGDVHGGRGLHAGEEEAQGLVGAGEEFIVGDFEGHDERAVAGQVGTVDARWHVGRARDEPFADCWDVLEGVPGK